MILIRAAAPALQYGDLRNRDVELLLDRLLDALRNGTRRPKATSIPRRAARRGAIRTRELFEMAMASIA
jgi:hypothetical protein